MVANKSGTLVGFSTGFIASSSLTPQAPQCGFSMAVSNMLKILEVNYKSVDVLSDQKLREGIKKFSEWPTVPQLYVKKEFVGGCDIVKEMFENGELKKLFEDKQIKYKK